MLEGQQNQRMINKRISREAHMEGIRTTSQERITYGPSPLTIAVWACVAMAVVGIIYVCMNPAVDAGRLAGM